MNSSPLQPDKARPECPCPATMTWSPGRILVVDERDREQDLRYCGYLLNNGEIYHVCIEQPVNSLRLLRVAPWIRVVSAAEHSYSKHGRTYRYIKIHVGPSSWYSLLHGRCWLPNSQAIILSMEVEAPDRTRHELELPIIARTPWTAWAVLALIICISVNFLAEIGVERAAAIIDSESGWEALGPIITGRKGWWGAAVFIFVGFITYLAADIRCRWSAARANQQRFAERFWRPVDTQPEAESE